MQVRDKLTEAKQHWIAMDYGTVDAYAAATSPRASTGTAPPCAARLQNKDLVYGYPETGYPVWMDNAMILADAQNPENAAKSINFSLEPENAAMISNFTRYSNGVTGSEEFMDEDMRAAPEIGGAGKTRGRRTLQRRLPAGRCRNSTPRSGRNCCARPAIVCA